MAHPNGPERNDGMDCMDLADDGVKCLREASARGPFSGSSYVFILNARNTFSTTPNVLRCDGMTASLPLARGLGSRGLALEANGHIPDAEKDWNAATEDIVEVEESHTGEFLAPLLEEEPATASA